MSDSQAPRKILLGKKVIRHFAVRSGIQTGAVNQTTDTGTDPSSSSGSAQIDTSTGNTCSQNTSTGNTCYMQTVVGGGGVVRTTGARC